MSQCPKNECSLVVISAKSVAKLPNENVAIVGFQIIRADNLTMS